MSHPDAMQEYDDEDTPAEMDDGAYAEWIIAHGGRPFKRLDDPEAQAQEDYEAAQSALPPHKRDGYAEMMNERADIERKRQREEGK